MSELSMSTPFGDWQEDDTLTAEQRAHVRNAWIARRRAEVAELHRLASAARKMLETPEGKAHREALFNDLLDAVFDFKPGDPSDKAIYVLGRARRIAEEWRGPLSVIKEYETAKENLDKITGNKDE